MPPRRPRNSQQGIQEAAGILAERWILRTLPNIGPPDFSSSSTAPRGLDTILNQMTTKAMQPKSIQDLESIINFMHSNEVLGEYPQFFQIFFHHLKSTPPAQCTTEADRLKVQIGAVSFHGIYMVHELLQRGLVIHFNRDYSLLIRTLTDSWPDLWKWIQYLYRTNPSVFISLTYSITTTSLRSMILRIVGRAVFGPSTPLTDAVEATPEVFAILVDIWAKGSEAEVVEEQFRLDSSLAAMAIVNSITSDPSRAQTLVELMGGDFDRIATLMLNNFRRAYNTNGRRAAVTQFQHALHLSSAIANSVPGLHHALLSQHSMTIVTRAFGRISSMRAKPLGFGDTSNGPRLSAAEFAMLTDNMPLDVYLVNVSCLLYIEEASRTSGGFTWIIQTIRSGLIPAVLRCTRRSSEEVDHELLIGCVTKALQPYLVYRSVLRAVSKAFQDPIVDTLESGLPRDGEFREIWAKFRELARLRLAAKERFDAGGEYAHRCSSARCNKVEGNESFRLCSNCQEACYCSPECQRYDWKHEGHREACASLRKDRADGVSPPISSRDLAFFHFLATSDVIVHRNEILKIRDETFAGDLARPHSFIIYLEPSSNPSDFFISTYEDEPEYRLYTSPRQYGHTPSTVAPRAQSLSVVELHFTVPYGLNDVVIPYLSDITSSLFGWESRLQSARPAGYMEINDLD